MKKFLKCIALMLLAGAFVLGFASCANDSSDSSNSSSGVGVALSSLGTLDATYQKDVEGKWRKIFLFSDGKAYKASQEALTGGAKDGIFKRGKFEKTNTYKDGTITITWEDELQKNGNWTAVADEREKSEILTLTNGTGNGYTLAGSESSTNTNDNTKATVSATYKYESGGTVIKFILYNDASFTQWDSRAVTAIPDGLAMKGTYEKTGDNFTECTIKFKKTHERDSSSHNWNANSYDWESTVSGGKFTFENKEYVLQN